MSLQGFAERWRQFDFNAEFVEIARLEGLAGQAKTRREIYK